MNVRSSSMHTSDTPLRILVGANVDADPNAGASGTVWQMNAALRRRGHVVDEIWASEIGRRIQHGNLHYLLELPRAYCREVRRACSQHTYDVIELNQPHAHRAAREHQRLRRQGIFVNRSHGHETRSEAELDVWRSELGMASKRGLRGFASRVLRNLLDRQWKEIAKSADGFVVSCSDDAAYLASNYSVDGSRIGVITQGVPQEYLDRPVAQMTQERLQRILYVGQLAFFKAPHVLAEAIGKILRTNRQATMTWICGVAHHDEARNMLAEEIRGRVTLVDWMDQTQLLAHLDSHGTFLFPSYFEGFGKAPLEAMSRGLCVTATSVGGMKDYIVDGVSGQLVAPGRPDLVADAALGTMSDLAAAVETSKHARATAEKHTWDRCAEDIETFYRARLNFKRQNG